MALLRRSRPALIGHGDRFGTRTYNFIDTLDKENRVSFARYGALQYEGFSPKQAAAYQDYQPPWKKNTMGQERIRALRRKFLPGIALDHVRYNDQYFPDHQFILLVESCVRPTTSLKFFCATYLSNIEIKAYLERFYGFRIDYVSSRIVAPLPQKEYAQFALASRSLYMTTGFARRLATVHLLEEVALPTPEHYDRRAASPRDMELYPTNPGEMPDPRVFQKSLGRRWRNAMGAPEEGSGAENPESPVQ